MSDFWQASLFAPGGGRGDGGSIPDRFAIEPIDYATAMSVVRSRHYLRREAPCSFAWGLFDRGDGGLVGVVVYGTPFNRNLRTGICGEEEKDNVIELTRLWTHDDLPRNSESYLIGNTVRLVDKEIVVSYADSAQGHVGYVYQATNWLYTGLSAERTRWVVDGVDQHTQTLSDKYTAAQMRDMYGDAFRLEPVTRKHRYVFLNANRRRRKVLRRKLVYPILPYPKEAADGERRAA
jgi:hypothetical protein